MGVVSQLVAEPTQALIHRLCLKGRYEESHPVTMYGSKLSEFVLSLRCDCQRRSNDRRSSVQFACRIHGLHQQRTEGADNRSERGKLRRNERQKDSAMSLGRHVESLQKPGFHASRIDLLSLSRLRWILWHNRSC